MSIHVHRTEIELFRNGSVREFYCLKALVTLDQVITSVVEKKNNLNEQKVYWKRIEDRGSGIGDRGSGIEDRLQKLEISEILNKSWTVVMSLWAANVL